jgi:hypothetical protein
MVGIFVDLSLMIVPILFLHFFVEVPFAQLVRKLIARKSQKNASEGRKLKEN